MTFVHYKNINCVIVITSFRNMLPCYAQAIIMPTSIRKNVLIICKITWMW